jgi:hypothetical protein
MNGRIAQILIFILCGAFLLIAGCTAPAPSGGAAPTPAGGTTGQAPASTTDLGTITSLLRGISDQVALVAENTRPEGRGTVTGNIILFDTAGNTANTITDGSSVLALPLGSCDIAVYGYGARIFTTVEEMKDYTSTKYSRNSQACSDSYLCRKTITLDNDYSYLYITYKPYDSTKRLTQVTLSYRCKPL